MSSIDLFPALHNRLTVENQDLPQFIGEFDGVDSFPSGDYPAIYFWIDKQVGRKVRLSFNNPKLESWCLEAARAVGAELEPDDPSVKRAIATLQHVSTPAFEAMLDEMELSNQGSPHTEAANMNQVRTNKTIKPWWKIW
ncbi:hypothetical protein [Algiphilus sp.]|uniref:hypothetical protein n=1 Tax=Algiphilus sp. TaxID=1872431 RepID=UPI0032ED792C